MRIENDRIVIEPTDVAGLSSVVQMALAAHPSGIPLDVFLTRQLSRLIDIAVKDFSAAMAKNISDIAAALAADPGKTDEVLPALNQVRTILGIEIKI